nr:MAG TPA: hypothetical protein [Caudoviricetes sp.]
MLIYNHFMIVSMGVKTKPTRLRWVTILQQADIQ